MAPEQEALQSQRGKADSSPYSTQADMFSLGVILFEMFSPPFSTYMERAGILTTLRGDRTDGHGSNSETTQSDDKLSDFEMRASRRFPVSFIQNVPINAQKLILLCVERDPSARPSAEDLLANDLLPRKIELEQRYLEEALELITNSQSESYTQILDALFNKPTLDLVELTFDTDVAVKANNVALETGDKRQPSPPEALMKAICDIRAGAIDPSTLRSLAMSTSSLMAATAALKRARNTGRLGKGGKGMLKRSTQRAAGVLAMRAATAAAVTGSLDGVHGADPTVVEAMCDKLRSIFRSHGAVHLRSPLLRPKSHAASSQGGGLGGPAEVMNGRGAVLLLPEDLTAPFARALGRGGAATSHLKRYDIDRVYHRSLIGGHPRESIEASFDVVVEDHSKARQLEAETIMVCSQVMATLPTRPSSTKLPFGARSPMWYLRISNTRLADAIIELCGVPSKDSARRVCFHLLSRFTAPPPGSLDPTLNSQRKAQNRNKGEAFTRSEELSTALTEAVSEHGVSKQAADKLRLFMESCSPVSPDIYESIESIKRAITKIKSIDDPKSASKREKRFEDAAKSLRSLQDLCSVLWPNLEPLQSLQGMGNNSLFNRPLYMSLDLGLRQRRKHYHGGVIFQAIVLPDNFFESFSDPAEHNELIVSASGRGMKIAEGGEFSDLVRKYRPPGNFASTFLSYYTAAPIPMCAGVRISVGKLIELVYLDAALSSHVIQDSYAGIDTDNTGLETLRQYLGHPLSYTTPIQCIVASAHGMDAASAPERFIVASRLWAEGVSAEYVSSLHQLIVHELRQQAQSNPSFSCPIPVSC
jgi:histidyl-tRNA synthetase